jgi:hypothetical protein
VSLKIDSVKNFAGGRVKYQPQRAAMITGLDDKFWQDQRIRADERATEIKRDKTEIR